MSIEGSAGFNGILQTHVMRAPVQKRAHSLRVPGLGRVMFTRDPGEAQLLAREVFASHLRATHRNSFGEVVDVRDLGSGLVTNIGVLSMANDPFWSAQLNLATLTLANNHASGKGVTAATVFDHKIETASTVGGQTSVAGVQTLLPSGTAPKYQTVATINYTGTEAVTEWGVFSSTSQSLTTGSPFTATTATSGTSTGTTLTASSATVRGLQGNILVPGTTAVWGLITSNTTSVFTVPAWYNQSNGAAGSTPGSTETYAIRPVMWDHRVFAAINVNNGDSIQFTYQLQINSGG
jgi:hypothetical protein